MGPGWSCDAFSGTYIEVRHNLDWDETKMWDSGLSCSTTWMEVTCEPRGMGGVSASSKSNQKRTHPGLKMCISNPPKSCLICRRSLVHTGHVSPQHMSWYLYPTSIQEIASQLHPSPISPYPGLMMCASTQSRSNLSPIQMSRFAYHLYPGIVKPRSRDLHLTS